MKFFPQLDINEATRDFQEEFGGYNHNIRIPENQFYEMKNMSGDYYPTLSPRKKRGIVSQLNNCTAVICKDALCYIDSDNSHRGHLYINGEEIEVFSGTNTSITQTDVTYTHVMVSMGAYLIIFRRHPRKGLIDGWFYNTSKSQNEAVELLDYGFVNNSKGNFNSVTLTPCGYDGKNYVIKYTGDTAPTGTIANGEKWLDTSGDVHVLKTWSASQNMWVSISTTYVKIAATGIAQGFKLGDAVTISGITAPQGEETIEEQLKTINTTTIIQSIDENYNWIVVVGIIDSSFTLGAGNLVKIERNAPYMDFICEHNNRLWGCRYGLNRNGDTVNEIYSCKQGDFKNWFCYAGISTDSYTVSVGSEEVWTGCTAFGSSVLFFKENCIHKIYGTVPSNFQTSEQKVRGIQRGSEKSMCFVNETLFYKSTDDICMYDGSTPRSISTALGDVNYKNAVFGSFKSKLYCNMQDDSGNWHLFVYDLSSQTWHREDNIHCKQICNADNHLYYVDENNVLGTFTGRGTPEIDFEWYAETGGIGYSYADNKYLSKLSIRLGKPITSELRVLIKYYNNITWEPIAEIGGQGIHSITIPIIPHRCDYFKLRVEGKGECKIYSLAKTIEVGSDV